MPDEPFYPTPETTVSFNAATGMYAFSVRFAGRPPHYEMDTFPTMKRVLAWLDPHQEYIWEPASDGDPSRILLSREYKVGSCPWRCQRRRVGQ